MVEGPGCCGCCPLLCRSVVAMAGPTNQDEEWLAQESVRLRSSVIAFKQGIPSDRFHCASSSFLCWLNRPPPPPQPPGCSSFFCRLLIATAQPSSLTFQPERPPNPCSSPAAVVVTVVAAAHGAPNSKKKETYRARLPALAPSSIPCRIP